MLYTRPRAEKAVRDRLAMTGLEPLLLEREVLRQWSDRKKKVREPLFPGYLFVAVTELERLAALQDEGVVKCVSFGGKIAAVPKREVECLQALQAVPDRIEAIARAAVPLGSSVMVTNGPLKGMSAAVIGHPKALYLLVEVTSIRQSIRVHVPADWVMRTAESADA